MRALALGLVLASCAARAAEEDPRLADVESFDRVWTTIHDRHWEERPGGLDWEALRDELRPRVERAATREEARGVIVELLDRLGQSHFGIIPAATYEDLGGGDGAGVSGLDVRLIEGRAVVTTVDEGSPAARAGVRTGWIVDRVEREPLAPLIERLDGAFAGSRYRELALTAAVRARLRGPVGDSLAVRFVDGRGRKVRRRLALEEPPGTPVQLGLLPPTHVRFERRWVGGDVGYVRFNMFIDPTSVMPAYNQAMEEFREAGGIVLDLRGNPGGIIGMAMGMAGWFIGEKDRRLGTMHTRDNELKVVVFPRPHAFRGPVAVLVDGLSASCSEILAGGLQDLRRARVFGARTMGAALPSVIEELPNGDGFQYAIAHYVSTGGAALEGAGVVPDVEIASSRAALLEGRDAVLEAALAWIHEDPPVGGMEVQGP
jgi:carboxyl-terminal processing protease